MKNSLLIFVFIALISFVGMMLLSSHMSPDQKLTTNQTEVDQFAKTSKFPQLPDKYKKRQAGPDMRPSDWAMEQRLFPYGQADPHAYTDMIEQAKAMRAQHSNSRELTWEFAGPANIGGRVSDLEVNPIDTDIVYAGAATGGVFKSTDGGWTWFPIFDDQAVLPVGDIALDPQNPDVVYVGTGEANGGHNNLFGGGVYKSTDGGQTWALTGLTESYAVGRIIVDPNDSERVYLAAVGSYFAPTPQRGVYRSTNGGIDWEQSLFISDSTGAIDIVMHPDQTDILYAAMWERVRYPQTGTHLYGPTSGIYKSTDGGDSWNELTNGLPNPDQTQVGRIGLALSESNPDVLYALYNDGSSVTGLYRTDDAGASWSVAAYAYQMTEVGGFSWYFGNVRVHPTNPENVFVLDVGLMASEDGGNSWPILYGYDYYYQYDLHVDHHALAFFPDDPTKIINGNDGGINISNDGGYSWTKIAELPVTQFYEIAIDYQNPERLYGGTQDNGTLRTLTGATNDWERIYGGDGFYCMVDYTNPDIIYAESQFGYLGKSTNGGAWFDYGVLNGIDQNEPTNWSTPVVMDPQDPEVLYYGTNRLYRTTNGAGWWEAISPQLAQSIGGRLGTITTIDIAPSNTDVIYVGCDGSEVWVTDDYGATWAQISDELPYRWVTRIAVDPYDPATAYVTFSGLKWNSPEPHVFRTNDMGQTWTDISAGLPDGPMNVVRCDPFIPGYIYVGSDVGCFYSTNAGANWEPLGTGMPIVSVYDIKIHQDERFLVAGTHARSMYKIDISEFEPNAVEETTPETDVITGAVLAQNYPNPFNPSTTIRYQLAESGDVSLKVYNVSGQLVRTLVDGHKAAGDFEAVWDGRDDAGRMVSSGKYMYQLVKGDQVETRYCTLLK